MQPQLPLPHTWTELAFFALALFLAFALGHAAPTWVQLFLARRKPRVEIHESESRIDLNIATAESMRLQTRKTGFELLDEMMSNMADTFLKLAQLEGKLRNRDGTIADQVDQLNEKDEIIATLQAELKAYEGQKELKLAERALDRASGGSNPA